MARSIRQQHWGIIDGKPVTLYTLVNAQGSMMKVTNYGAIITELHLPDARGKLADVVLGFDSLDGYLAGHPYFGAIIGRCANRIENARFDLNGQSYQLARNSGTSSLHGGVKGFDRHVWDVVHRDDPVSLTFTRVSPDGEENFPGNLDVTLHYTLTDNDELICEFIATTDKPTICNLAQHTYWNLGGHESGTITGHVLQLDADEYTPSSESFVPTGEYAPVAGTALDFRTAKPIGQDIEQTGKTPAGYDHNFVVNGPADELKRVGRVTDPQSGRSMELYTNQPGCQLYTANFLDGSLIGKGGVRYNNHHAFCLETQKYPDAIHQPHWPTPILRPDDTYRHTMIHRFSHS